MGGGFTTEADSPIGTNLAGVMATVASAAILTFAASGRFVFETTMVGSPPLATVASCALASSAGLLVMGRLPSNQVLARVGRGRAMGMAGCGALAFGVAPALALSNRFSDAPSGSVSLFWLVAFLGFALVFFGWAADRSYRFWVRASAALIALAGAAGVLANWERPSSFSLLTRHSAQQAALAASSLLVAAALVGLVVLANRLDARDVHLVAALGAAAAGLVLSLLSGPAQVVSVILSPSGSVFALFSAVFAAAITRAAVRQGPWVPGAAMLAVPSALTLFTFAEAAVGALGPRPVLLGPVAWASAAVAAGCYGLLRAGNGSLKGVATSWFARATAVVSLVLGSIGMLLPAVAVAVRGLRTNMAAFQVRFTMAGFETVGGWLAFALALFLLLDSLVEGASGSRRALGTLAVVGVVIASWMALRFVPLHVWVGWIPSEVQQDYGTEYASIVFSPTTVWAQVGALVAAGISALVAAWLGRGGRISSSPEAATEER